MTKTHLRNAGWAKLLFNICHLPGPNYYEIMTNFRHSSSLLLLFLAGCGGAPSRVVPEYPASNSGSAAVQLLDADADGTLKEAETEKAPGLKAAFKSIDADGNGGITANEIDARVQTWANSKVGRISATLSLTFNGAPLANVEVKLVPEPFLGTNLKTAVGTTNASGFVTPTAPETAEKLPGAAPGFYRVEVTGPSVPAKFSTETTLGVEIAPDSMLNGPVKLELK